MSSYQFVDGCLPCARTHNVYFFVCSHRRRQSGLVVCLRLHLSIDVAFAPSGVVACLASFVVTANDRPEPKQSPTCKHKHRCMHAYNRVLPSCDRCFSGCVGLSFDMNVHYFGSTEDAMESRCLSHASFDFQISIC